MITFVLGFQDWQWAVGTGVWIDDIVEQVAVARAGVEQRVRHTFLYIGGITLTALLTVFLSGLVMNIRERRLADAKLKELTQRVFDAQEEERGRVARELHDRSSHADAPFVSVDPSGVADARLADHLFGDGDQRGSFQEASGGTLFIAEICELSPSLQQSLQPSIDLARP